MTKDNALKFCNWVCGRIDPNIYATQNSRIVVDCTMHKEIENNKYYFVIYTLNGNYCTCTYNTNESERSFLWVVTEHYRTYDEGWQIGKRGELEINIPSHYFKQYGSTKTFPSDYATAFSKELSFNPNSQFAVHSIQVYSSGTLVHNYVPAHDSISAGLYDTITQTYTPSSSADATWG